jgi:hypothetical protein
MAPKFVGKPQGTFPIIPLLFAKYLLGLIEIALSRLE